MDEEQQALREFDLVLGGYAYFQAMVAGARLGLFSRLSAKPDQTFDEIVQALPLPRQSTRALLLALAAVRLIKRDAATSTYRNAPLTERYLVAENEGNALPGIEAFQELCYRGMFRLEESLRAARNVGAEELPGGGATLYERISSSARLEKIFHDWMSAGTSMVNAVFEDVPELASARHLIDVGGGDGTNAIVLARRYPALRVTIFDAPTVCARAAEHVAAAGLSDRIATASGDMFDDPFPTGADVILFCHITSIYSPDKNRALFQKSFAALPDNGSLAVLTGFSNDEGTGPLLAARQSLYFVAIATGTGMVYSWEDYESWLLDVGFTSASKYLLEPEYGLVVAGKG